MIKSKLTILFLIFSISLLGQDLSQKLDEYLLSTATRKNKFNGSALVAVNGQVVLLKGYGFKDKSRGIPNDANTIYQVGSITKTFTAAEILRLQEQGKLQLTDNISTWLPDFPNPAGITIQQLLTHSSGIFEYLESPAYAKVDFTKPMAMDSLINFFKSGKRGFPPGQKFSYTNSGYILLAAIIEKLTGKKYEQVIREEIFNPLQMEHAGFDFRNLADTNKAVNYENISKRKLVSEPVFDSTQAPGCGGMIATVMDLYKWDRGLRGNKILDSTSIQKAYTPYIGGYGYGWFIDSSQGRLNVSHGGGTPGFHAQLQRFINQDICIILLSNNAYCDLGEMSSRLADIIFRQQKF